MKLFSKEFYDLMAFFERTIGKIAYVGNDFSKEPKDLWLKAQYYCNGQINNLFKVFIAGYVYKESEYEQ